MEDMAEKEPSSEPAAHIEAPPIQLIKEISDNMGFVAVDLVQSQKVEMPVVSESRGRSPAKSSAKKSVSKKSVSKKSVTKSDLKPSPVKSVRKTPAKASKPTPAKSEVSPVKVESPKKAESPIKSESPKKSEKAKKEKPAPKKAAAKVVEARMSRTKS